MKTSDNLSNTKPCFVFREPRTAGELADLLRLRYRVFSGCRLAPLVRRNANRIDLDAWDRRSSHFGLYRVDLTADVAVGYIRVAEGRETPFSTVVERIAEGCSLQSRISTPPARPYPLMSYFPDTDIIEALLECLRSRGEDLVEPSRLVMAPEYRTLRLSRFIIEASISVYFFQRRVAHAMGSCDSTKIRFYELFGFHRLPGSTVGDFLGIDEQSCCVFGSRRTVPEAVTSRLERMASALSETEEICLCPFDRSRFTRPTSVSREPARSVDRIA